MNNPIVSNPKDFQVVSFHNSTSFDFTPDMGCMYDSRSINGVQGGPGIKAGETMTLPYHIGHQLAKNLAKMSMVLGSGNKPQTDANGQPIIKSIWDDQELERVKKSFLTDLYTEDKPTAMSETDKLMAKVEEYKKMVDTLISSKSEQTPDSTSVPTAMVSAGFQDKAEVIAELEKRNVVHDKRKSKAELEKLLA